MVSLKNTLIFSAHLDMLFSDQMLAHHPTPVKQQSHYDHDLTELSWLTRSDIFDSSSTSSSLLRSSRHLPTLSKSLPTYANEQQQHRHRSSPLSLVDSSDSEHDNDSSSLNSSSERVPISTNPSDIVSPPHSALCFWILFAIEESKLRALTLNEICDWIERHIEQQQQQSSSPTIVTNNNFNNTTKIIDEQLIRSARLKSKIRYHMTKQISFFVKIIKDPVNGIKLRYPLWTTDRSKRLLLLDTLLTMNTRQLSLYTQYTRNIYERLCSERRRALVLLQSNTNDENSCPSLTLKHTKRDKTIHRLGSAEETNNNSTRKKQRSRHNQIETNSSSPLAPPSVEVVDAAMTLLLLRQPK